jgi:DNA-binding SARP family transcriptional activator
MTRRLTDFAKGLASLAALVILLGAIPYLLWQISGTPGSQILDTLEDQFASDNTRTEQLLAGTLALIAWACWAQLAYAVAVEMVAAIRGRTARRAPILPGLQALAYRLVTGFTLVITSLTPAMRAVASPLQPLPAETTAAVVHEPTPAPLGSSIRFGSDIPTDRKAASDGAMFTVGPRDTLWSIADATLGDGLRWAEIRDANLGRTMPDGTTVTADTETVRAGWNLRLPAGAVLAYGDQNILGEAATLRDGRLVEVNEGDHFWGIAEHAMADGWGRTPSDAELVPYWADVVELNTDRLLPPEDPDLIYPGQVLELPPIPAEPHAPPAEPAPVVIDVTPTPPVEQEEQMPSPTEQPASTTTVATPPPGAAATTPTTSLPSENSPGSDDDTRQIVAAAGLASLAVGAGAVALTLRRRRAYQAVKREPGKRTEPPPTETISYEAQIRQIADVEAVRWIETTNKFITHRLAENPDHPLPAVTAMRAGKLGVEILLDDPCPPLPGFTAINNDNTSWRLDHDLELADVNAQVTGLQPYSPALLPVGTTPGGELLVDFEQLGPVGLDGDHATIEAWLRALASATSVTPWAEYCEVIGIGLPDDFAVLPNLTRPDRPDEWADRFCLEMRRLDERLTSSPYEQRVRPGETFHPSIVFVGPGHTALANQLADVAALVNTPLAVIAVAPLTVPDRIHLTADCATLEPSGVDFTPAQGNPTELASIALLLDNAARPATEVQDADEPPDTTDASGEAVIELDAVIAQVLQPRPIEVRILTPRPNVHGLGKEPPAKQVSVICYLAFHRDVSSERLRDTFWPTSTNRSTADNAISQVRALLGTGADGKARLDAATNTGNYQISGEVGCDWTRFTELVRLAKARPHDAMSLMKAALDLVDGRPGGDAPSRQFRWLTDDIDLYGPLEASVVDAAHQLGELALGVGDRATADAAAVAGLSVVPGHEALYRIRMRAAAEMGDFDTVDSLYSELSVHLMDGSIWGTPEGETESLVEALRLTRAG